MMKTCCTLIGTRRMRIPWTRAWSCWWGPDRSGALLEIGLVGSENGTAVIVHAMRARPKFLR